MCEGEIYPQEIPRLLVRDVCSWRGIPDEVPEGYVYVRARGSWIPGFQDSRQSEGAGGRMHFGDG